MKAEYVFSSFLKEIKNAWKGRRSQDLIINSFYSAVITAGGLEDECKDKVLVNVSIASKVFNRKKGGNVNKFIRNHIDDDAVRKNLPGIFEENIIPKIMESNLFGLISHLNTQIQKDSYISKDDREHAALLADGDEPKYFLTKAFILSLQYPNVLEQETEVTVPPSLLEDLLILSETYERIGNKKTLPRIEKPVMPDMAETGFIIELLKAYGSHLDRTIHDKNDLPELYQEDMEIRREDFYAAETVRIEGVDALQGLTVEEFDRMKDETYRAVRPTYIKSQIDGVDGYDCMQNVMNKAESLTSGKSLFYRTGWIAAEEQRGICQMLAGEKKLQWVKNHE